MLILAAYKRALFEGLATETLVTGYNGPAGSKNASIRGARVNNDFSNSVPKGFSCATEERRRYVPTQKAAWAVVTTPFFCVRAAFG